MQWLCANCSKIVLSVIDNQGVEKPASHYWRQDMSKVFCSAQCSLDMHEKEKSNKPLASSQ